jgi:hypothetical protein
MLRFFEVFLDGKYIGHQFTGTLIRQENAKEVTKTFVGFTRVAENINDLSKPIINSSFSPVPLSLIKLV